MGKMRYVDKGSKLVFEFIGDCKAVDCVNGINSVLAQRSFSCLSIAEDKSFFQTVQYEKNGKTDVSYNFGFRYVEMEYENKPGEEYVFQLNTYAFPKGSPVTADGFREYWKSEHQDRVLRVMMEESWKSGELLIAVLHHAKEREK